MIVILTTIPIKSRPVMNDMNCYAPLRNQGARSLAVILLAILMLGGCQADNQGDPEATMPEAAPDSEAAPASTAALEDDQAARAEALAQALAERQARAPDDDRLDQRAQLRDQMLERRREVLAGRDGDSEAGSRRALSPRDNWWEDEALADSIAISASQKARLAEAASELDRVRSRSRQALATSQRELIQAFANESPDLALDLVDQRRQRAVDLAEADAAWLEALIDTLTAEQVAALIRQQPQLIMGRGSVGAARGER